MKQLFKHLMFWQAIIFIGLLFFGCRRDSCDGKDLTPKTTNYLLSEIEKGSIPYNGNETLTFISKFNDTAIFIGQGLNQKFNKVETRVGSIDCPSYLINNFEYFYIDFFCIRIPDLKFSFEKFPTSTSMVYSFLTVSNVNNIASNTLTYASDSLIVTDSIPWTGGYQKGKILSGKLNVIYNSKIGILKFENSDTLWTRIPNN